jgi:hypothetical protein
MHALDEEPRHEAVSNEFCPTFEWKICERLKLGQLPTITCAHPISAQGI